MRDVFGERIHKVLVNDDFILIGGLCWLRHQVFFFCADFSAFFGVGSFSNEKKATFPPHFFWESKVQNTDDWPHFHFSGQPFRPFGQNEQKRVDQLSYSCLQKNNESNGTCRPSEQEEKWTLLFFLMWNVCIYMCFWIENCDKKNYFFWFFAFPFF